MTIRQVSAPLALAVSLVEAKATLRLDADDTSLDALIGIWIKGVTAEAEHTSGRAFVNRAMRLTLDDFGDALQLVAPTFSVESVEFDDETGQSWVLDPQDYFVDLVTQPGYIVPGAGKAWPATGPINSVRVNFTAGYGPDESTVPDAAKTYILARLDEQWSPAAREFTGTSQSLYMKRLLKSLWIPRL